MMGWISLALGVLGLGAIIVFTLLLRAERRLIKDLKPTEPVTDRKKFGFLLKANDEARSIGLIGPEWYEDTAGMLGRAKFAMWISQDRDVIVLIAQNTSLVIYQKITLLSRLEHERVLKTVNGDGESDLLGFVEQHVCHSVRLLDLMAHHLADLDLRETRPVAMRSQPILLEYEAIERDRVQRMVDRRLAMWLTGPDEPWCHTTLGAFLSYFASIRNGFFRSMWEGAKAGWKEDREEDHGRKSLE